MEKNLRGKALESAAALAITRRDITDFMLGAVGFFMGRVVIFGDVNPLGIAYLSTFFLEGKRFYIAAFFTFVGILTRYPTADTPGFAICILSMCVLNAVFSKRRRPAPLLQSLGAGALAALSGIAAAVVGGGYLYFILMAILWGLLTVCAAFVIQNGMRFLQGRSKRRALSQEDLVSLAIIAGGIVAGSADIYISNVSLRYYFCAFIVMLTALRGGLAVGATTGVLLGVLLEAAGFGEAHFAVVLAVGGMVAGSLKTMARQLVAAGFALGAILSAAYLQGDLIGTEFLFSVLFAGITFLLLPDRFAVNLLAVANPTFYNPDLYIDKLKERTTRRLQGFAGAFQKLSRTFSGISEKRTSLTQKDVSNLIDDVAAKTCADCAKKELCWEEQFYNTYQTVFSMLNACEKKGRIDSEDIPEAFRETCADDAAFSAAVGRVFELYKTNLIWHNRMVESRELVSEQLGGVAKVITQLADELDETVVFKDELEKALIEALAKEHIEVNRVIVLENKQGKYEVSVSHQPCYGKKNCAKSFIPVVNSVLGRRMKQDEKGCLIMKEKGKSVCKLNFLEEQRYGLTSAVARVAKEGGKESGDSYSYMELKNGQCILALSDGMGTGKHAREESAAAIDLLEEFIETGFDKDTAVRIINSVLLLRFNEESFSTLDICSVDLYSGQAEFVKIGASSTFLLRGGDVSVVRSWSLPVGILNNVELDVTKKQLKNGDLLVMVTDGVLDAHTGENKEEWVAEALRYTAAKNPQDIADLLIDAAKNKSGGAAQDDMTVLTAKFWEK